MGFEWHEEKNKSNFEKHGISFDEALEIFSHHDDLIHFKSDYVKGEIRETYIGLAGCSIVIVVIATQRDDNLRLISARIASRKERKVFYEYKKSRC